MALDILVVDDEADVRAAIAGILADEGHAPRVAANSDQALAALAEAGWIAPGAILCAEYGVPPDAPPPGFEPLAERTHGAAHLLVLRRGEAP